MWAVDNENYTLPVHDNSGTQSKTALWQLTNYTTDEDGKHVVGIVIRHDPFVYTLIHAVTGQKMSFIYNGDSVKPTLATLKKYGAEALQPVVSFLRDNKRHPYDVVDGIWDMLAV